MQNAYKKPDTLKLFMWSIFRIAYHKTNIRWSDAALCFSVSEFNKG